MVFTESTEDYQLRYQKGTTQMIREGSTYKRQKSRLDTETYVSKLREALLDDRSKKCTSQFQQCEDSLLEAQIFAEIERSMIQKKVDHQDSELELVQNIISQTKQRSEQMVGAQREEWRL